MRFGKTIAILGAGAVSALGLAASAQEQRSERADGPSCTVTLERNQPDGVFDVTRQVFDDGSCNCFVYTGSQSQPANVEARVSNIARTQRCPDARPMSVRGPGQGASLGAGQQGAINSVVPVLLFAGAAAGVVILIEAGEDVSP